MGSGQHPESEEDSEAEGARGARSVTGERAHGCTIINATHKQMPKESAKQASPKTARCLYCRKRCTSKGVYEHERHHCPKNPNRRKRSWGKVKCRVCGQMYHSAGLRTHMALQHPLEFAKEKARKSQSSKAAMRRRAALAERKERHEVSRSNSPRRSRSRPSASSPNDGKERNNTESGAMAQIQREMLRTAAGN